MQSGYLSVKYGTEHKFFWSSPVLIVLLCIMHLSIGSLGKDNSTAIVTKVVLDTALLKDTTNGLRIKTWQVIFLINVGNSCVHYIAG